MADSVRDTLTALAEDVLSDPSRLSELVVREIEREVPELAADAQIRELVAANVQETITAALQVFRDGPDPGKVATPTVALQLARRLAQRGVPITSLLRAYRLGQAAFQQEMISRIAASDATAHEVATAASQLSSVAFSVVDNSSEEVVAAYQVERDEWMRQRNTARLATVTAVLAGMSTDVPDIESVLGYGLAGSHLAVVLWSTNDVIEPSRLGVLERLVPKIGTALVTTRPALVVAPDASTLWAWFAGAEPDLDALTPVVRAAGRSVHIAVGEPGWDIAGFRQTHRQARQAQIVALAAEPTHLAPAIAASQLGPLLLLAAEPADAAGWVQSVLGALADDTDAHGRLRETLWAYLASGSSLAAAGAQLHLHKNTIQYRIRKAEEARGRSLQDGRIDVEIALLACRVLGSSVLRAPDSERARLTG